ncbi:hypothetical protein C8R45DRAFT_558545 [Mycena sanguinolenta]|nr:hypothetical protein C8R45DRAFT_558545 [Mycena sanguinolenta]
MENRKGMEYEVRGQREKERRVTPRRYRDGYTSDVVDIERERKRGREGMCGRCSNEAEGWRMLISPSTAPRGRAPLGAHRDSALSDTGAHRLARGYRVRLPRRYALDLVWGTTAPQHASRRAGCGGVPLSCRCDCGGSSRPSRLSPSASIHHPSAAPDIYGTLLLLFRTPPSTLSCPSPIDYSNTWFCDRCAGCASFASSGCAFAALLWCTRWIPRRRR